MVALDNEIMLSVETLPPEDRMDLETQSGSGLGSVCGIGSDPNPIRIDTDTSHVPSLDMHLSLDLSDILEDSVSIDMAMKYALELSLEVDKIISGCE